MNNSIYKFNDYKIFLRKFLLSLPKRGHGEISRIAGHLDVNSALVSQIINGPKDFTLEQGHELALYLGLGPPEADYFFLLLGRDRAGTHRLKKYFQEKIDALRRESLKVAKSVTQDHQMNDTTRAIFYSSWVYVAARLLTSLEDCRDLDSIAKRLRVNRTRAAEILRFLVEQNLCVEEKGRYKMGPQRTHLEHGSPFLSRHHLNWRAKATQALDSLREDELMFTAPLTISRADFAELRESLLKLIQELSAKVKDSRAESLFCLNLDLFEVR